MQAGLAGSDPLLLTRLMAQLTALLQAAASKRQQQLYSEWVPLQAYLALLQAHAQYATAGPHVLDEESRQVVQAAQAPHYRYVKRHTTGVYASLLLEYAGSDICRSVLLSSRVYLVLNS